MSDASISGTTTRNRFAILLHSWSSAGTSTGTRSKQVADQKDYPRSSFPFYIDPSSEPPSYMEASLLPFCLPLSFDKNAAGYSSYCLQEFGGEESEEMLEWMMVMH